MVEIYIYNKTIRDLLSRRADRGDGDAKQVFGAAAAGHGFGLAVKLNVQRSRSDTSYGHHGEAPSYGRAHGDGWCLGILG